MKPIKCWVAQDSDQDQLNEVYLFKLKPKKTDGGIWLCRRNSSVAYLGTSLIATTKEPIKCVVITEEEYNKLKGPFNERTY